MCCKPSQGLDLRPAPPSQDPVGRGFRVKRIPGFSEIIGDNPG